MAISEVTREALIALEETVMWADVAVKTIVEAQGEEQGSAHLPNWVHFHEHTIEAIRSSLQRFQEALHAEGSQ